jgi:hypothetical protein
LPPVRLQGCMFTALHSQGCVRTFWFTRVWTSRLFIFLAKRAPHAHDPDEPNCSTPLAYSFNCLVLSYREER